MSSHTQQDVAIRNVAIATDFSPCSDRAMQHALAVARHFGAVLHFLHIVRPSEFAFVPDMLSQLDELANRDCDALVGRLEASHELDNIEHRCWTIDGEVSEVFGNFTRDQKIDLLVLGTRGRSGISKLLLGSIAQQIFHYVFCPVLTVGPWSRGVPMQLQLKKLLFATDLSAESAAALPYLLTVAKVWHADVDVLHVCSSKSRDRHPQMEKFQRRMDELLDGVGDVLVRYHMLPGNPSTIVLDFAKRNREDLIVLGLQASRALYSGPSWSHAYEIVRQGQCPVLSARSLPVSIVN